MVKKICRLGSAKQTCGESKVGVRNNLGCGEGLLNRKSCVECVVEGGHLVYKSGNLDPTIATACRWRTTAGSTGSGKDYDQGVTDLSCESSCCYLHSVVLPGR